MADQKPFLDLRVTRCVCADTLFADIVGRYDSVAEMQLQLGCGSFCGMCIPWLQKLTKKEEKTPPDFV